MLWSSIFGGILLKDSGAIATKTPAPNYMYDSLYGGGIYDLNFPGGVYYSVSRDQSKMYFNKLGTWTDCDSSTALVSYAMSKQNNTVVKFMYKAGTITPQTRDVIQVFSIGVNCSSPTPMFTINLWNTVAATSFTAKSLKATIIQQTIHLEIQNSGSIGSTNAPYILIVLQLNGLGTIKFANPLPSSFKTSDVISGTVRITNEFLYLVRNTTTSTNHLSLVQCVRNLPSDFTQIPNAIDYPVYKNLFKISSGVTIPPTQSAPYLDYPAFDYDWSVSSLTFDYYMKSEGQAVSHSFVSYSFQLIGTTSFPQKLLNNQGQSEDPTRYFKFDSFIDVYPSQIVLSNVITPTLPYYSAAKRPNPNTYTFFLNNGIQFQNVNTSFQILPLVPNPTDYLFYVIDLTNQRFDLYCDGVSSATPFQLQSQKTLQNPPNLTLSFDINNKVQGVQYPNGETVLYQRQYTFSNTTSQVGFSAITKSKLTSYANGVQFDKTTYSTYQFHNLVLSVSNPCQSTQVTQYTNNSNLIQFTVDTTLYKFQETTYSLSFTAMNLYNGVQCTLNSQIVSAPTATFNGDPYLKVMQITPTYSNTNNSQIQLSFAPNPLNSLMYYFNQQYTMNFQLIISGCNSTTITSDSSALFNNMLVFNIPSELVNVNSQFSLKMDISNGNQCNLQSTSTFSGGANPYLIQPWYSGYSITNGKQMQFNFTTQFVNWLNQYNAQVDIIYYGCPVNLTNSVTLPNTTKSTGLMQFVIPAPFRSTQFYMDFSISGTNRKGTDTCIFKSSSFSIQNKGPQYNDDILYNMKYNSLIRPTPPNQANAPNIPNGLSISLSNNMTLYTLLQSYIDRQFTLQMRFTGLSYPITNQYQNFNITQLSELIPLNIGGSCTQNVQIQMTLSHKYCYMTYQNNILVGSGKLSLDMIQDVQWVNNLLNVALNVNGINGIVNTIVNGSSCGTLASQQQNMPILYNQTTNSSLSMQFSLPESFVDTFSKYSIGVEGLADYCQFESQKQFRVGTKTSRDSVLDKLVLTQNDVIMTNGILQLNNQNYTDRINYFNSLGYKVHSELSIIEHIGNNQTLDSNTDVCWKTNAINLYSYDIPTDYYNNTGDYQVKTTITSDDCSFSSQYQFHTENEPIIDYAYYKFGQIEILGSKFGNLDSCHRKKQVQLKIMGAFSGNLDVGIVRNASIEDWANYKIVIRSEPDVGFIQIKVGNFVSGWISVIKPLFRIKSYMNAELLNGKQHFEILLNRDGLKDTDIWEIDSSNDLFLAFSRPRGNISDLVIFDLDRDKTANGLAIYFTINSVVPGVIIVELKRTPTISGQNLTPNIYTDAAGNYLFSVIIKNILKYSLVDYPSLSNKYDSDYLVDNSRTFFNESQYVRSEYQIDAMFKVSTDAVVGSTSADGARLMADGFMINIGSFQSNVSEVINFVNSNITWKYDNQNTKILKVGDFPLKVQMSLSDSRNPASSADFPIVAILTCDTGSVPNVFGATNNNKISLCAPCPDGSTCSATGNTAPDGKKGFYEILNSGVYQFAPCYPAEACLGTSTCQTGYAGDRCGDCAPVHYKTAGGYCKDCPKTDPNVLIAAMVIFLVLFSIILVIMLRIGKYLAAISIAINYFQILYVFKSILLNWSQQVYNMFDIVSIFSFNIEIAAPECIDPNVNYFTKGEVMFLIPPSLLVILLFCGISVSSPFNYPYLIIKGMIVSKEFKLPNLPPFSKKQFKSNLSTSIRGFHILLQFIFVSLCSWSLGFFNCVQFGPDLVVNQARSFVCYQGTHLRNLPYFISSVAIYAFGIPLYFTFIYFCMYQTIFKSDRWISIKDQMTKLIITENTIYKPNTQFIVVVQIIMKLIILASQNFIGSVPTQAMIIQLTIFTYIGFLIYFKPYVERDHTLADIFCQICCILTLSCGILFLTDVGDNPDMNNFLTALVIGITCVCVVGAIVFVGRDFKRGTVVLTKKLNEKEKMATLKKSQLKEKLAF
eukprot:NODE_31_length_37178_cov_0.413576.p1 type:complete len:1968 gc:universal NODE_31_length_37178_cov_0.413576:11393-5490(-)